MKNLTELVQNISAWTLYQIDFVVFVIEVYNDIMDLLI